MPNFTGNGFDNALTGSELNDVIKGLAGNDILDALAGNDILNGGLGIDTMYGGSGNDTYTVDNVGDIVSEDKNLDGDDGGIDTVKASVSFALGNYLENLVLTGSANINGTGNRALVPSSWITYPFPREGCSV